MPKFAISDIHGCARSFQALLDKIQLAPSDTLYLLGDYVDRGPASREVIDLILDLQLQGYAVYCLKGNHEESMLRSRFDLAYRANWEHWGGKQTLESFGLDKMDQISEIHKKYWVFLSSLSYFFEVDDYILVHAGLSFGGGDPLLEKEAMLWSRPWNNTIDKDWLQGRKIVHGHTPIARSDIRQQLKDMDEGLILDIDSGCFFTQHEGLGHLCAFDLTNRELHFQPNIDPPSSWKF